MLHERSQTQKAACCMIPLRLILEKANLQCQKNKKKNFFFARALGKGLITKGFMRIFGEVIKQFAILIVVMVTRLKHLPFVKTYGTLDLTEVI